MAFGQPLGPPATARQVQELTELLHAAGHLDFRDARGPLGLTQRQAGGRFTRDEADELITRLQQDADGHDDADGHHDGHDADGGVGRRSRQTATTGRLAAVPSEELAAELQQRGWVVMEP